MIARFKHTTSSRRGPVQAGVHRIELSDITDVPACPTCGLPNRGRHQYSASCRAMSAENEMRKSGFVPVRGLAHIARTPGVLSIETTPGAARGMLIALGFPWKFKKSYANGSIIVRECWTTREGLAKLCLIRDVRLRMPGSVSIPEAVRRIAARMPNAAEEFDAARRLGADDDALRLLLEPLRRKRR